MIALLFLSIFMLVLPIGVLLLGDNYTMKDCAWVAGGYLAGLVPAIYFLAFVSREEFSKSQLRARPYNSKAIGLVAAVGGAVAAPLVGPLIEAYLPLWVLPTFLAAAGTLFPSGLAVIHFKYE